MRGRIILLLVAFLASGCNTRQRVAGGGVGLCVIGIALTYSNEARSDEEVGTQGKVGITLLLTGLVTLFVAAALEESANKARPKEVKLSTTTTAPEIERAEAKAAATAQTKRARAWELTKQAQEAARAKDCAKVTELSAEVGALDHAFYSDVFMQDVAVQNCFVPAEDRTPVPPLPAPVPPTP